MVSVYKTGLLTVLWCLQDQGIVAEVFKQPEKFHLTLGVLRIFSKEEEVRQDLTHTCTCVIAYKCCVHVCNACVGV